MSIDIEEVIYLRDKAYITIKCPNCGETSLLMLPLDIWKKVSNPNRSECIQDIIKGYDKETISIREVLITGLCENCQKEIFTDN